MFKIVTLAALGFAAANATFLEFDRLLQTGNTTSNTTTVAGPVTSATYIQTTCVKPTTTVDPCNTGYCCAYGVKTLQNGTVTNTTAYTCVPAEADGVVFAGFGNATANTSYSLSSKCALPATATSAVSSFSTNCTSTQCLATRTYTLGTQSGSSNRTACLATASAGTVSWTTFNGTSGLTGYSENITATCPVVVPVTTTTTGSFGVYAKASAMMLVALISAMFF